ncbi:hypothetical protein ACFL47_10250 [Candidatus Latescibacterota bacterium]
MINVIIIGSTGMIGSLVQEMCLSRDDVSSVTSITRRNTGVSHPKLTEIIHDNFLDFSGVGEHFKNQDVCFYCLGVYTGAVSKDEFRTITVDFTSAFSEMLRKQSVATSFCFLSGQGADQTEKSRVMFARDKGAAENMLLGLDFENTFIFRPGYIYPSTPRKEPNFSYKLTRWLYKPILSRIYPNIGISSADFARAMVETGFHGGEKTICENKDIRNIVKDL